MANVLAGMVQQATEQLGLEAERQAQLVASQQQSVAQANALLAPLAQELAAMERLAQAAALREEREKRITAEQQKQAQLDALFASARKQASPTGPAAAAGPAAAKAPAKPVLAAAVDLAREQYERAAEQQAHLVALGQQRIDQARAVLSPLAEQLAAVQQIADAAAQREQREKKIEEELKRQGKQKEKEARDARKGKLDALTAGVHQAGAAFVQAEAQAKSFLTAASPGAVKAIDGAMGLLAGTIGQTLVPYVGAAVNAIMEARDWFDGLSDSTKSLVGTTLAAGAAMGVLVKGISMIRTAAAPAVAGVKALHAALVALTASPIGATIALIGAGLAALGGGLALGSKGGLTGTNFDEKAQDATGKLQKVREHGGMVRASELETANLKPEDFVQALGKDPREVAAKMRREIDDFEKAPFEARHRPWWGLGLVEKGQDPGVRAEQIETFRALADRIEAYGVPLTHEEEKANKRIKRERMVLDTAQREQRPQYNALADARKQIQLAALGMSPFEREQLALQRQAVKYLRKQLERDEKAARDQGLRIVPI
jgi:hypothetical protein